MAIKAHHDFETRSACDLKVAGAYAYFEHWTTNVICMSYGFGDDLVYRWRPGEPDPKLLLGHVQAGGLVGAHNASFERLTWRWLRSHGYGHWPELPIEQQDCTMSRANALGLPADLDNLGQVLGLLYTKDKAGYALMRKLSRPKVYDGRNLIWHDDPAEILRLQEYCDTDVKVETLADRALPPLSPAERELWVYDQRINDRGIYIDRNVIAKAADVVEIAKHMANRRIAELTDGAVQKTSQTERIVKWLNATGVPCESIRKDKQAAILEIASFDKNQKARDVIELRKESTKTSTAKFAKMLDCACEDGRMRGLFAFRSTRAGRWAGRLAQPQNYPRMDYEKEGHVPRTIIQLLSAPVSAQAAADVFPLVGIIGRDKKPVELLTALSKSLRSTLKAAPGKRLYGGDFANIEGRGNAWLAGETWKLEAFEAYDNKTGPDLYLVGASGITGKPVEEITEEERQAQGKVPELACGYQGGVGAFVKMTETYLIKLAEMVEPVRRNAGDELWRAVCERYDRATDKHGLPYDEWAAVKITVTKWRENNKAISSSWYKLEDDIVAAVARPDMPVYTYNGKVCFVRTGEFLYVWLPSGRCIPYCHPELKTRTEYLVKLNGQWVRVTDLPLEFLTDFNIDIFAAPEYIAERLRVLDFEVWERRKQVVSHYGVDGITKQWGERYLYGGLTCENIVQGVACDVLCSAILRLEKAGYEVVLHAHDEAVSEHASGNLAVYKGLMETKEKWMDGFPIAVKVWEDERYVK